MIIKNLNSVFHRHSKWLFGVFTVVIIISFMGFLTPGQFGLDMFSNPENREAGVAFGEKVTIGELRSQAQRLAVAPQILYGFSNREPDLDQAFQAVALLRAAAKLGITASDSDVAGLLTQAPPLQTNGKFDMQKYRNALSNLSRAGITEEEVTQSLRELLIISGKLERELASGIIVTPGEVENFYRMQNTAFQVRTAQYDAKTFAGKVKISSEELKKYFETHNRNYMVKGKLSALVAAVDYAAFRPEAEKLATDAALLKYFNSNPMAFAAKDAKKAPEFAAVKTAVRGKFLEQECRELAGKKAYAFAAAAFDMLNEKEKSGANDFRQLAAREKLPVVETGYVEFDAETAGKIQSAELIRQLSKVAESNPVTNVVMAGKSAYVGFLTERMEASPAKLSDVKDKVLADLRHQSAIKAARNAAEKAAAELGAITDPVKRLAAFAALKDCTFKTVDFSREKPVPPELSSLAFPAMLLAKNETSGAEITPNGAIIGLMEKRILPDMKNFSAKKAETEEQLRWLKLRMVMQNFQQTLSAECRLLLPRQD